MLMFQAVAIKIGKKEDKFTDPEKKAAENLAAKLGMILSNYNEGSALHKIDKKAIKNLKETLEEIKNNKFKTEDIKNLNFDGVNFIVEGLSDEELKQIGSLFNKLGYNLSVEKNPSVVTKDSKTYYFKDILDYCNGLNIPDKEKTTKFYKIIYGGEFENYLKYLGKQKGEEDKQKPKDSSKDSKGSEVNKLPKNAIGIELKAIEQHIDKTNKQLNELKDEYTPHSGQSEEYNASKESMVTSDMSKEYLIGVIGLDEDKQNYFFGDTSFSKSTIKQGNQIKYINKFNTKESLENLQKMVPPAIEEKLKARPGVTDVFRKDWENNKDQAKLIWSFNVNGKPHNLVLYIDLSTNEKGMRSVKLEFLKMNDK